jgi:hypothetical protein
MSLIDTCTDGKGGYGEVREKEGYSSTVNNFCWRQSGVEG